MALYVGMAAWVDVGNVIDVPLGTTASDFTVMTQFSPNTNPGDTIPVTDRVQEDSGATFEVYSLVNFSIAGGYNCTTHITSTTIPNFLPLTEYAGVTYYEPPLIVNPVNISVPTGGDYNGPVATATSLDPNETGSDFSASILYSSTWVPATIPSGSGNSFTVTANINFAPGNYFIYDGGSFSSVEYDGFVQVAANKPLEYYNDQGWGRDQDNLTFTAPGTPQFTTSIASSIIQVNATASFVGTLATVFTTDTTITSASQVTASSSTSGILVTGTTLTQLSGGLKEITIQGIVNTSNPGPDQRLSH